MRDGFAFWTQPSNISVEYSTVCIGVEMLDNVPCASKLKYILLIPSFSLKR